MFNLSDPMLNLLCKEDFNWITLCNRIESGLFLIILIIFSYIIGSIKYPDELDEIIQYRNFTKKIFFIIEILCLILIIISYVLDYLNNYYFYFGFDLDGSINLMIKLFTIVVITYFTFKSNQCYNYNLSRLIIINTSISIIIITNIFHLNFILKHFEYKIYLNYNLALIYSNLGLNFIYFTVFNFIFFVQKRHSLYYENFADNISYQTNIGSLIELEENKSFFSKLTFTWINCFLKKALNNQINRNEDILRLPFSLNCLFNYIKLNQIKQVLNFRSTHFDLRKCLWKRYKKELFNISFLKTISDIGSFFTPILLNKLFLFLDSNNDSFLNGFIYVFLMFLTMITASISINLYDFYINNIGIKVKCSIHGFVYRKLFKLKTQTLYKNYSNGELINFFSVDSDRISNIFGNILQMLSLPTQLLIAFILLYNQIGLAFLASVIFCIILMPINKIITSKITKLTSDILKIKDQRIKTTSKLFSYIKTIKINNYENIYYDLITNLRKKEIQLLKKVKYLDAICVYLWATTPVIVSTLTFIVYVLLGNNLDYSTVFTSMVLLNMLISPLNSFPWVIQGFLQSWISLKRIQKFLNLPNDYVSLYSNINKKSKFLDNFSNQNCVIKFSNAIFTRNILNYNSSAFKLGPLCLEIKKGSFIGVIGSVGSGKTSFLEAILCELIQCNPNAILSIMKFKGLGYLSQQPWIQNNSIKENILFGKSFVYKSYNEILKACDLYKDLKFFTEYDETLIGDKGITLSDGQKSRIALARALYQDFDIYLIDDIFASLDSYVASHVYENCILKLLKDKTRILATHHIEYLKNADFIIKFENGKIVQFDTPEIVLAKTDLKNSLTNHTSKYSNLEKKKDVNNYFKEELNEGYMKLNIYNIYFKSIGWFLLVIIGFSLLLMQFSKNLSDLWLSFWMNVLKTEKKENIYYLKIFFFITIFNSCIAVVRSLFYAYGSVVAARNLHAKLLNSVLKMKISFFNIRPFGQIINRFSSDIFHIDENLPFTLNIFLSNFVGILSSILVMVLGFPSLLIIFIFLAIPYFIFQKYYRHASMKLERINSNTLSPIYSHLSETLDGLTIIKSFSAIKRFISNFEEKIDINNSAQYTLKACTQWLNLRLQLIGILISCSISLIVVTFHYYNLEFQFNLLGLALTYSVSLTSILYNVIKTFTEVEMDMVSVERIEQYLSNEDKEDSEGLELVNFPKRASIEFRNVSFRYNSKSNLALNSISFIIHPKEIIGIIGRTGSGKSSIFQCLFRMYDLEKGNIFVDKQDIKNLSLKTLRKSMYIVSQDVFLFDGTIRKNLDPYERKKDFEIWIAIQECNAKSLILKLGGLNAEVNVQICNLSCGEKQIISLIRAFLYKVKILCLDEATSSIDIKTENNLYKIIRKAFAHSTILIIVHKLSSLVNCEKIMLINEGKIEEMDYFEKLISDPHSKFYKIWNSKNQSGGILD